MPSTTEQALNFVGNILATGDQAFVDDFIKHGPAGKPDANTRYLLAVALRNTSPARFAEMTAVSVPVATALLTWVHAGIRS